MLRAAAPADTPAILSVVVESTLFLPHEASFIHDLLDRFHAGQLDAGHRVEVWVDEPSGPPVGVTYFGPDAMTDRKWDLWMIAVTAARQGQGVGGELLRAAEAAARAGGGRLLLIETSSLPRFDATHAFYRKHGYTEVARIPDFYTDGDSKVIFSKRLAEAK